MFVITINDIDTSCHTKESDATVQKQRFISNGVDEEDIVIVEKDTFNPPQE